MNLFDMLVTEALRNQPSLSPLKIVVEKELLHHDILRILSQNDFLKQLTFIGGTCLRACYGAYRLSEDLDFTGGKNFTRNNLSHMGQVLIKTLEEKYSLNVQVKDPIKDISNVDTWKIIIVTRPTQKHLPAQRINIDICSIPSYEKQPMLLINPYGVDMGTNGLVIQAQSREEIYADKLLAFALRPNRLKFRDLWDTVWLHQQGIKPRFELIPKKLQDRHLTKKLFLEHYQNRLMLLVEDKNLKIDFEKEMQRFLPFNQIQDALKKNDIWSFIIFLLTDFKKHFVID